LTGVFPSYSQHIQPVTWGQRSTTPVCWKCCWHHSCSRWVCHKY